jgi:hypothetical protein
LFLQLTHFSKMNIQSFLDFKPFYLRNFLIFGLPKGLPMVALMYIFFANN